MTRASDHCVLSSLHTYQSAFWYQRSSGTTLLFFGRRRFAPGTGALATGTKMQDMGRRVGRIQPHVRTRVPDEHLARQLVARLDGPRQAERREVDPEHVLV